MVHFDHCTDKRKKRSLYLIHNNREKIHNSLTIHANNLLIKLVLLMFNIPVCVLFHFIKIFARRVVSVLINMCSFTTKSNILFKTLCLYFDYNN